MTRSYSSFLFWLGMTIVASLMLYHTSDRVHALDQRLRGLNTQIQNEQQSLHVLKAEWVYLANPARIEAEAQRHLGLSPTAPRHVAGLRDIAALLPVQNGAEPAYAEPAGKSTALVKAEAALVPVAAKAEARVKAAEAHVAQVIHTKRDRLIAALNTGRINDHMVLTHAAALPSADHIGALIGTLGLHP